MSKWYEIRITVELEDDEDPVVAVDAASNGMCAEYGCAHYSPGFNLERGGTDLACAKQWIAVYSEIADPEPDWQFDHGEVQIDAPGSAAT